MLNAGRTSCRKTVLHARYEKQIYNKIKSSVSCFLLFQLCSRSATRIIQAYNKAAEVNINKSISWCTLRSRKTISSALKPEETVNNFIVIILSSWDKMTLLKTRWTQEPVWRQTTFYVIMKLNLGAVDNAVNRRTVKQ